LSTSNNFGEEILRGLQPFTAFSEHPESSRYRLIAQLVTPDYVANPATATHADILFKVDGQMIADGDLGGLLGLEGSIDSLYVEGRGVGMEAALSFIEQKVPPMSYLFGSEAIYGGISLFDSSVSGDNVLSLRPTGDLVIPDLDALPTRFRNEMCALFQRY
jgi:hypothetical protein